MGKAPVDLCSTLEVYMEEKINPGELSSDLHLQSVLHMPPHTHTQTFFKVFFCKMVVMG